jgi:hypothetical protein
VGFKAAQLNLMDFPLSVDHKQERCESMVSQTNYKVSDNGIERDANADEIAAIEENAKMFAEDEKNMKLRAHEKAKVVEKFAALGFTAEELTALIR